MQTIDDKWLARRRQMVERDLRGRGIADEEILRAFLAVPRERFLPASQQDAAYEDHPLPIGRGQTISQPLVVAMMIRELACGPGHRVLDVGAGSGYQTAILSHLVEHVYAVERINELTEAAIDALAVHRRGQRDGMHGRRHARPAGGSAVRRDHMRGGRPERAAKLDGPGRRRRADRRSRGRARRAEARGPAEARRRLQPPGGLRRPLRPPDRPGRLARPGVDEKQLRIAEDSRRAPEDRQG